MIKINEYYKREPGSYLFAEVARRVSVHTANHPDKHLIPLGIGDVTRPLPRAVLDAMHAAVDEQGTCAGFRGYGPYEGYDFLREKIAKYDFTDRGISILADEIFVSDGAKSDCGNIGDLFAKDSLVAVCDPVYPVYADVCAMNGGAGDLSPDGRWSRLIYMPCTESNGFIPDLPKEQPDLIWLCLPNNPTGATATRSQLKVWVDYARTTGAVILFDAAYEAFVTDPDVPHSIFEIEGARECAIEFRSFSKTAGFTGTRCAYAVIPHELVREGRSLRDMWFRRQSTKFNGVPYIIQRGAEAVYSPEGRAQVEENIAFYRNNAQVIRNGLQEAGFTAYGGVNSPYIWLKTPNGMGSWDFFDLLLEQAGVVTTPGAGFGPCGEGFIRLTGFGSAEDTKNAVLRISNNLA